MCGSQYGTLRRLDSTKDEGEKEMRNRMLTVLRCMKAHGHDALVLGAFGCGVFRNDPIFVASVWNTLLRSEEFNTCFQHVSFGIISGAPSRPSHKNDKKKKKKNDKKKKEVVDPLDCFRKEFDEMLIDLFIFNFYSSDIHGLIHVVKKYMRHGVS